MLDSFSDRRIAILQKRKCTVKDSVNKKLVSPSFVMDYANKKSFMKGHKCKHGMNPLG